MCGTLPSNDTGSAQYRACREHIHPEEETIHAIWTGDGSTNSVPVRCNRLEKKGMEPYESLPADHKGRISLTEL